MRRASDALVCVLIAQINVHTNVPLPRQLISRMGGAASQGNKTTTCLDGCAHRGIPRTPKNLSTCNAAGHRELQGQRQACATCGQSHEAVMRPAQTWGACSHRADLGEGSLALCTSRHSAGRSSHTAHLLR